MRNRILMIVMIAMAFVPAAMAQDGGKAEARMTATGFAVEPGVPDFHRAMLVVSGPDAFSYQKQIGRNEPIGFSFNDVAKTEGNRRTYPDGEYSWQVRMVVDVKALENPRHVAGVGMIDVEEQTVVRSGSFSVLNGAISSNAPSSSEGDKGGQQPVNPVQQAGDGLAVVPKAATHHVGDVTITGDICVGGTGCASTYFPLWDIEVVDVTPAIRMTDSRTTPTTEWYLWSSDNSFQIQDGITSGSPNVFQIIEGAPANSIHVSATGSIGLRTTPVATSDLHFLGPDYNAAIRLEESLAGSFADILSGNGYLGFGHEDLLNSYSEPFRISKGAPNNALTSDAEGDIGLGLWVTSCPRCISIARMAQPR